MKYPLLCLPLLITQNIVRGSFWFPPDSYGLSHSSPPPSLSPFEQAIVDFDWSTVSNLIEGYNPNKRIRKRGSPIVYLVDNYLKCKHEKQKTAIYKTMSILLLDDRTALPNIEAIQASSSDPLGQLQKLLAITRERRLFNVLRPLIDKNIINDCPDDVISTIIDFTTYDTGLANVNT